MKSFTKKILLPTVLIAFLASCDKTNEPEPESPLEYNYIRLIVSDEKTTAISLVNPKDGTIESFSAKFPKSAIYTTESGRFVGLVHRENNYFETFDSGFELHGDHVDVRGTAKFGALVGESKLPTHFKSKKGEVMLFNDGDGTLSVANESEIHSTGLKLRQINAGNVAHHGAMATFSNGTYAITEKDGSIAGTLPERVKVIDNTGKTLFASKIATKGIHGNATDGKYAVFGSASGILVIESTGEQRLLPLPESFGTAWFGTILETAEAGKFIGYTAAKGAYLIDVVNNKISPIFENTDIMQCVTDYSMQNLVILLHSGEARIYDLKTNTLKKSGNIIAVTEKTETQKPTLVATKKNLYLTAPKTGEIVHVEVANLSNIKRIKVSATPYRMSIFGFESNESH